VQSLPEFVGRRIKAEVQIVLNMLVMVGSETADRKGGHLD
jgi:hypothetical protein